MARANRHFIPGCIWHITHRCHKKEFLLKFAHDRHRFVSWLREARKRFGIQILHYTATSNHLLVKDTGDAKSIPSAVQLVAGRSARNTISGSAEKVLSGKIVTMPPLSNQVSTCGAASSIST
jgi:putative transposase